MIIGYSGVWSHEQFIEYIERKLVNHQQCNLYSSSFLVF